MRLVPLSVFSPIRSSAILLAAFSVFLFASSAVAADALTIEEAKKELESGQYFSVVGEVVRSKGNHLYEIEDETGRMLILISDSMIRKYGNIEQSEKLQLWGKYDHKKLDDSVTGMRVSRFYRLGRQLGGQGQKVDPAATTPSTVTPLPPAPAAMNDSAEVIRPMATEKYKQQVRANLQAYRAAEAEAVQAGQDYARAAREAGSNGQVDPEVVARLEAAEAKVV